MVYVNSKTKNADNAVDYIAFLLSDDFLAEQFHHSYIAKDLDSYFSYQPPKTINKDKTITIDYDAVAEEYKWRKYPSEMGMTNTFLVQNGSDIFTNAAPRLYTYSLDKFLDGIYSQLTTLTPEEAADAILKEANYKLME